MIQLKQKWKSKDLKESLPASYKGLNFIFSTPEIEPPQDYIRFYAHINKRYVNFTIEDYKEVKYHVFALLAINHNVATHHIKGWFQSLHLEWYVTSQAVPHMMKMALRNKNDIIKERIVDIQIGKRSVLDDQVATVHTGIIVAMYVVVQGCS